MTHHCLRTSPGGPGSHTGKGPREHPASSTAIRHRVARPRALSVPEHGSQILGKPLTIGPARSSFGVLLTVTVWRRQVPVSQHPLGASDPPAGLADGTCVPPANLRCPRGHRREETCGVSQVRVNTTCGGVRGGTVRSPVPAGPEKRTWPPLNSCAGAALGPKDEERTLSCPWAGSSRSHRMEKAEVRARFPSPSCAFGPVPPPGKMSEIGD